MHVWSLLQNKSFDRMKSSLAKISSLLATVASQRWPTQCYAAIHT